MLERTLTVVNPLGLHARAAAKLARLAHKFESSVSLQKLDSDVTADGKSILSILYLAARKGAVVRITVDGPDEDEATGEIERLFTSGFGES